MKTKYIRRLRMFFTAGLWLFIFLFSLFCCFPLPAHQYLVDQWDTADGLPGSGIRAAAQTPDGYLWFATSKGLVRFDGITFSTIHFIKKQCMEIQNSTSPDTLFVDKQGILWIGSPAGLTKFHYKTGQFTTFTTDHGLTGDRIRRINEDMRGNLWISFFASYLNRFSNDTFTVFNEANGLEGKKITAIVEDTKGNLLFATRENGIFKFQGGYFFKYPITGLSDDYLIITMREDKKGALWIGTNKGLLKIGEGTNKVTDVYTTQDGLWDDFITAVMEDSSGNTWVGTAKGLNRMKEVQAGKFHVENLLGDCMVTCLFGDNENSLWIGTYNSGIKRLKESKFISYAPMEKLQKEIILSIFEDRKGHTWIGTLSGKLYRCRHGKCIQLQEITGISGCGIIAIAEDNLGNLWLGTNGKGVFKKKGDRFINFTTWHGLADNLVSSIFNDSKNNIWFSTFDGVSRWHNGVVESLSTRDGLSGKRVNNVYEDKDHNIWIASCKGINVLKNGAFNRNHMITYLEDIPVTCIYEDKEKNVFWIATDGAGLKRLKHGSIISFTTANGMTSNSIFQMMEDEQGNLWMMSESGVLRVSKKELNRFANGRLNRFNCTSFGIPDGMKSIEFTNKTSRHSLLKNRKGEFWFVTKKGITIVNPAKIRINKFSPPVIIEHIVLNGHDQPIPLPLQEKGFKGVTEVTFHFTAPTFLYPQKTKFKYKLEGFDRDWVFLPPGEKRIARYRDLDPGTYTFRVTAGNSYDVWNRIGASMTFTLRPFFYETLLFKMVIFFIFTALITGGYFLYKKCPLEKKRKYRHSFLNPQFAKECIKKLMYLMEIEKLYRDENISLQSLSEKLSISPHLLSQILNEKLNKNFPDFINTYRIEETKNLLRDPDTAKRKILAIAFDVGFKTKTAFNSAFKKHTKMTPSDYKKRKIRGKG